MDQILLDQPFRKVRDPKVLRIQVLKLSLPLK